MSIWSTRVGVETTENQDKVALYFIVDDSPSMANKQKRLAANLKASLKDVRGRDLDLRLYSSTQFASQSFDPQTGLQFSSEGAFSNYTGLYMTIDGKKEGYNQRTSGTYLNSYVRRLNTPNNASKAPFLRRKTFFKTGDDLFPLTPSLIFDHDRIVETFYPAPSAFNSPQNDGIIRLTPSMSEVDFNAALDKVAQGIELGEEGASDGELLNCSLAHLLNDPRTKSDVFSGNNPARAAFFLLTDEDHAKDDSGKPLLCPLSFESVQQRKEYQKVTPEYRYERDIIYAEGPCDSGDVDAKMCEYSYYVKIDYNCLDETGRFICAGPENAGTRVCSNGESNSFYSDAGFLAYLAKYSLKPSTSRKCLVTTTKNSASFPDSGFVKSIFVKPGISLTDRGFEFRLTEKGVNQRFEGTLLEYFKMVYPRAAFETKIFRDAYSHIQVSSTYKTFPGVTNLSELNGFIRTKADEVVGRGNYQVTVIGNLGENNPSGCDADPKAVSTSILELASPGQVMSVCDSNYNIAIDGLKRFLKYRPQTKFEMPEEMLFPITVTLRDRLLEEGKHYTIVGHKIILIPSAIDGSIEEGDEITFASAQ